MEERVLAGRYRIVRHIARGGMAEVFLGRDELLGRTVAIKVLFPEMSHDPSFVERFRREARSAAALNHPNIVSVFDFGEDDGSYFIVMEYVDGVTLRDLVRRGPMDPQDAVRIAAAVAKALAAAHAQGTVHRDVKPANVLIADDGVKVTDFGIARAADAQEGLTQPGMVLGTARYLSPEQAHGKPIDHRSDIFSMGTVLYEMLAGHPPFPGESPVAVAARQRRGETPPPPSSRNRLVPPALDALVAKAMSVDPAARHRSAAELREALVTVRFPAADPDATVAAGGAEATEVLAAGAPATAVLPPVAPTPDADVGARSIRQRPAPDAAYRRRRAAVIAVVLLLLLLGLLVVLSRRGGSERVTVPAVVGLTIADATSALDREGLDARIVEQNRPGARGQVIEQDPRAGAEIDRGSTVSLFVAGGDTSPTTRAPTTATTRPPTTTTAPTTTTQAPTTTSAPPVTTAPRSTSVVPSTAAPSTTR